MSSRGHIPPHQRCWLVFFENEIALRRDVGAQELVDGAGDGVAEDGGVADEQLEVLLRVEEGRLDEDGGHGRAPQHREVGRRLDAAVREALVDAADGAPERLLHRRRERVAPRVRAERVRLAAAAAAGRSAAPRQFRWPGSSGEIARTRRLPGRTSSARAPAHRPRPAAPAASGERNGTP